MNNPGSRQRGHGKGDRIPAAVLVRLDPVVDLGESGPPAKGSAKGTGKGDRIPGALIGSELFVREMAAKLLDTKRALRKRLAPGLSPGRAGDPPALFAYRRLPALD